MDMLKGLAEKAKQASSGGNNNNNAATTGTQGTSNQAASGQEDYVDKGVDAAAKKFGINMSSTDREKYTDMGRTQYEKQTGSKVNPKFSN